MVLYFFAYENMNDYFETDQWLGFFNCSDCNYCAIIMEVTANAVKSEEYVDRILPYLNFG